MIRVTLPLLAGLCFVAQLAAAAELLLPQNRNAFFSRESIEIVVAGLPAGGTATLEAAPADARLAPLSFEVKGDGATALVALPPYSLAPGEYLLRLDGKDAQKLVIASGTNVSPMLLSQTMGLNDLKKSNANFVLGNAFSFGLLTPDGTDPLNQQVNEIPSTHVFVDWGYGKLGVIGALYLEKAHQPTAKIAHAMNGQLFGKRVAQPGQRDAYRLTLNSLLAAGLKSNWWLNTGGMTPEDLASINAPGQRLGPLFLEMSPSEHDVAVLWSFTEIALREKAICAKEARKKTGEQIKLMVASLPENTALKEGQMDLTAYSVGGNYKEQVLTAHQALSRAGYPAHIIDERSLARSLPRQYKTLVIVGQTFELPNYVKQAISDFTNDGGHVVIDHTTTVRFENALVTEADFKDPAFRWTPLFVADKKSFKSPREASYFQTNYFMDDLAGKPELRIAIGGDAQRPPAEKLKAVLAAAGVRTEIVAAADLIRKARYPRVWDPYIKVHKPTGAERQPPTEVKLTATIETAADGRQVARTTDGDDLADWRKPGTRLDIIGAGFIDFDYEKFYEQGCVLFVRDDNQLFAIHGEPIEMRSTDDVRQKWSRPWTRLKPYVGTDKLCPQLPEAYSIDSHLIVFGDSESSELAAALQASELLLEVADEKYPGPGKSLVSFVWSPFAVEKNLIFIGASDAAGIDEGIQRLARIIHRPR